MYGENGPMANPPPRKQVAIRPVCVNRRARFDYELLDTFEAGIVLTGAEVKALREGQGQLVDAYASLDDDAALLFNFEIAPYRHDHTGRGESRRARRLLLHRAELRKLASRLREQGLTLVPLAVYFRGPWAKLELALARGQRKADKRQKLARREAEREIDRGRRRR